MISLSTAWNSQSRTDIGAMLSEIRSLGFQYIEIGYTFGEAQLKQLLAHLPASGLKVSSVHNFCPKPDDGQPGRHVSNPHLLSALSDAEHRRAVQWTKRSIDTAAAAGARVLVIHAGTVDMDNALEKKLMELFREGMAGTREFFRVRDELIKARAAYAAPHLDRVLAALEELLAYAQKRNIKIGLENRYHSVEIPNLEEVEFFLEKFETDGLGYWHDTGHAEISERLGLAAHLDYLFRYESRLLGMHIHGVKGLKDHQAPFVGDFDFAKITPYFKRDIVKVIESHQCASAEEIRQAMPRLS